MSMSDVREELSLALGRWHDAIREAAPLPHLNTIFCPKWRLSDPNMIFWIHCYNLETSDRDQQREQLEGLELLARLSRVDWKLWRHHVEAVWGQKARAWQDIFRVRQFRVGIDLCCSLDYSVNEIDDNLSQLCERIVTRDHMGIQSFEFARACTLIASLAASGCGQDACAASEATAMTVSATAIVPVRLHLIFAEESELDATNLFFRLMQLAITQRVFHGNNDKPDEGVHPSLSITHIQLTLHHIQLDDLAFQYLGHIRSQGIRVCELPVLDTSVLSRDHTFVRSMQSLLLTSRDEPQFPLAPPVSSQGIDVIMLSDIFSKRSVPGVLSAVHDSSSLRAVHVNFHSNLREKCGALFWHWLAFGLFSRPQNSMQQIQEMTMFVRHLRMQDVDLMRRILSSDHPLAVLYEEAASTEEWVSTASPIFLVDPSGEGEQHIQSYHIFDSPQQHLEVINRSNDEYVSVLLPGWGKAWVRCCDAITVPPPTCQASPSMHSIPHLSFKSLSAASTPAFLALLQLIGHGVRSLLVDALFPDTSFDDLCAQVFQMCPHLETLELERGRLASVQPLLDSYCAGTCRLRRLVFVNVRIQDGHNLDPIFIALQDKNHPIATHLQELKYTPSGRYEGQLVRQETVDLVLRMLERNEQLRLLDLDFIGHVAEEERRQEMRRAFAQSDNVKLPVRLAPMAMRRKWAFLSVVSGGGGAQTPEKAIRPLDSNVVSVIFQFAVKCCTRVVRVKVSINDQE